MDALNGTAFGALLGAVIGTMVSIIPSLAGGLLVTALIDHLHPQPMALIGVKRDLRRIFTVFVAVLNAALLLAIFTLGRGLFSITSTLPYILAGDVLVALMLWRASASISRATAATNLKSEHGHAHTAPRARAW